MALTEESLDLELSVIGLLVDVILAKSHHWTEMVGLTGAVTSTTTVMIQWPGADFVLVPLELAADAEVTLVNICFYLQILRKWEKFSRASRKCSRSS